MRVLAVLDIMSGQVMRGVGGRRKEYRPIISRICASSAPLDVARAFRAHFGLNDLYLADLDAIDDAIPAYSIYSELISDGFHLWIDAGVKDIKRVHLLAESGVEQIIVGLETARPSVLAESCAALGDRIIFSLDLKEGVPLGDAAAWPSDAERIVDRAVALGVRRLVVLDLAQVGAAGGTRTEDLCARLIAAYADVEVIAGGGVRGPEDLQRLRDFGIGRVLVASALHDGRLTRADWESL